MAARHERLVCARRAKPRASSCVHCRQSKKPSLDAYDRPMPRHAYSNTLGSLPAYTGGHDSHPSFNTATRKRLKTQGGRRQIQRVLSNA